MRFNQGCNDLELHPQGLPDIKHPLVARTFDDGPVEEIVCICKFPDISRYHGFVHSVELQVELFGEFRRFDVRHYQAVSLQCLADLVGVFYFLFGVGFYQGAYMGFMFHITERLKTTNCFPYRGLTRAKFFGDYEFFEPVTGLKRTVDNPFDEDCLDLFSQTLSFDDLFAHFYLYLLSII